MNPITNNNLKCTLALAALQSVYDPEIGLNVVDLGLIYGLDFDDPERKIYCTMTLTTQFCPMGESIRDNVTRSIQTTFPGDEVEVSLTFEPPWNYTMISEEGKKFLGR
jgi:metal-sulfur cluster biosynthetic enzyme